MDLSFDYWDTVQGLVDSCHRKGIQIDFNYDTIMKEFRNDIITIVYGANMAIILIVIYYLLRPRADEELFRRWWRTAGNKMFPALCILTICAIVALLTLSSRLLKYSFVSTDSFCNSPNVEHYQIGYGMLCFLVTVSIVTLL
jgi:hypothetical protein